MYLMEKYFISIFKKSQERLCNKNIGFYLRNKM